MTQPSPPSPRPSGSGLAPWLVIGAALVLAGLAVMVVVLLSRGGAGTSSAGTDGGSPAASSTSSSGVPSGPEPDEPRYGGSEATARAWVQAMQDGEFQAAFDLSCAEVRAAATASAAEGDDPAWALGTYVFEQVLGGVGFGAHTFEGIVHDSPSDTDLATFSLVMDDGTVYPLQIHVVQDGTVCDFR